MDTDFQFSSSLEMRNGFMYCEDVRIKDLQTALQNKLEQPSPFYLYSKNQLIKNIYDYKSSMDNLKIEYLLAFSVKSNYNPNILNILKNHGCSAVVVSGNELNLALRAGIDPQTILVNGNGKQEWEIGLAIKHNCLVNVDSEFDLRHISQKAEELKIPAKILLRLNPNIDANVHPYLATGLACSKFGMYLEGSEISSDVLDRIEQNPWLELVGLHCHLGSTIDNVEVFRECLELMIEITEKVKSRGFTTLRYLNLGGGLGIDYKKHSWRTNSNPIGNTDKMIQSENVMPSPGDLISKIGDKLINTDLCLILEPGRSLIGSAVTFVTTAIGTKKNGTTSYLVVDGSMNEVIRPALYGAYHHIELTEPTEVPEAQRIKYDVVGPICECGDVLGKDRWLKEPHEGCGAVLFDAGAYCGSMGSNYNLRMRPAEVIVDGSQWLIIRKPELLDDFLKVFNI